MDKKCELTQRICVIIYGVLPAILLSPYCALASEITFDTGVMHTLGLNKNLNSYFSEAPRFLPGTHSVSVKINGKDRGMAAVRFNEEGVVCVDKDFTDFAGLVPVPQSAGEACHDIRVDYPDAVFNALPNQEAIELVLPQDAVNSLMTDSKKFLHGGVGGLLNYSIFSTQNDYGDNGHNRYSQASLEAGMNAMDWALRSRYIITDNDGTRNAESIYTYAEHVFVAQKMTMQLGEINAFSSVMSGVPITGVQVMPTNGLTKQSSGVSVLGIARSSQARVEVRQNGQLVYSTLVPAGPFTLDDVPVARNNVALDVSVIESSGAINRFTVPASQVKTGNMSLQQGLTISAGQVRRIDSDYDNPLVLNISDGWRISPWMNVAASGVAAENYQALGGRTDFLITDQWSVSTIAAASSANFRDSNKGVKTELQSDISLNENVRVSGSATHFNGEFREISDAIYDNYLGYDNSYSGNISLYSLAGVFTAGVSYNQSNGDNKDSRFLLLSWGKTFKYASITANWQSTVGNSNDEQDNNMFYVNLSIPLGGSQSVSTYIRKQGDSTSYGASNSGALGNNTNYYISTDRDQDTQENSFNGNINTNLHYTQLGLGGGTSGNKQKNYNTTLSGGVALHKDGVTFSPYFIHDTFAIASLSEKKSGVEISTPQGSVWTDLWGQAVVPSLNEWRNSRIEINANKLPQSMTLANGTKYIAAGHASVSEVNFKVLKSRRVMLLVKQTDGTLLGKGLSVVDGKNNYVATTVDGGHVFINDADPLSEIYVLDSDNNRLCKIDYALATTFDENTFYEEANGVCR